MKLTTAKRYVRGFRDTAKKNGTFGSSTSRETLRRGFRDLADFAKKHPEHGL